MTTKKSKGSYSKVSASKSRRRKPSNKTQTVKKQITEYEQLTEKLSKQISSYEVNISEKEVNKWIDSYLDDYLYLSDVNPNVESEFMIELGFNDEEAEILGEYRYEFDTKLVEKIESMFKNNDIELIDTDFATGGFGSRYTYYCYFKID